MHYAVQVITLSVTDGFRLPPQERGQRDELADPDQEHELAGG
jgi:hypothetical protein